jgi:preprotein translocase subunit SecG
MITSADIPSNIEDVGISSFISSAADNTAKNIIVSKTNAKILSKTVFLLSGKFFSITL